MQTLTSDGSDDMSDAQIRRDLFDLYAAQLDPTRAGQVMDLFPPAGASELVTRDYFQRELAQQSERFTEALSDQSKRLEARITQVAERASDDNRKLFAAMVAMWATSTATTVAAVIASVATLA